MSVVLIGFMGAGKSAVGKALAERTGLEFVDTDALVEDDAGMSVEEIWKAEGEIGFRSRESVAVANAVSGPARVIASGGGAVLSLRNYQTLRKADVIVYLRTSPDELRARLGRGEERPLLADPAAFDRLLAERAPAYESAADLIVDTDERSPEDVAAEIVARIGAS